MKNKELLPCPFCGGEAEVVNILWLEDCFLTCKGCGIVTPSYDTEEAIATWNRRANTNIKRTIHGDFFTGNVDISEHNKKIRAEAIKEFAEKLKDRTYPIGCFISVGDKFVIGIDYIDELVKEMVGAKNE